MQPSPQLPTPLWRRGFRPFFLLSGLFAILSISAWVLIFLNDWGSVSSFSPLLWHAHEMIFGYTTAVIAGFLLTASQNWSGLPGLQGPKLMALVALWLAGRVAMALPMAPSLVVTAVDLAFYPSLALAVFPHLKPADMKVERIFFLYFALYFLGNLLMHLEALNLLAGYGLRGALLGLNVTVLMIIFMGGRVIPFFAASELARSQPRAYPVIEVLSHGLAWSFLVSQLWQPSSPIAAAIAFAAGAAHLARLAGWWVRRVRRVALLMVLYLAYSWIVVGLFLSGLTSLGRLAPGPMVHAFTVGGLGLMTYGMMSRVALGHTGRGLRPHPLIIAGYAALTLAALVRVFGAILTPSAPLGWVSLSGALWIAAFLAFILIYLPMLIRPRVDGKRG